MTEEVTIVILDKTYQIRCPKEKVSSLRRAAEHLNKEMRTMRQSGVVGMERIAVITALNLAHSLMETEAQRDQFVKSTHIKIQELQERIDEALTKEQQLELNNIDVLG